jgi:hypothetical protein
VVFPIFSNAFPSEKVGLTTRLFFLMIYPVSGVSDGIIPGWIRWVNRARWEYYPLVHGSHGPFCSMFFDDLPIKNGDSP